MSDRSGAVLIVTPACNEAANLAELHRRLAAALDGSNVDWRWLLVDDASADDTFAVVGALAKDDIRVGAIRLGDNVGSHRAILAALRLAATRSDIAAAAVLAADLQDPPEALPYLIAPWRQGAEIVFGVRRERQGTPLLRHLAARLVHASVRLALRSSSYPRSGTDMALFGRGAIGLLAGKRHLVRNVFVAAARLGMPTSVISVNKERRFQGASGWSRSALVGMAGATVAEALGLGTVTAQDDAAVTASVGWVQAGGTGATPF